MNETKGQSSRRRCQCLGSGGGRSKRCEAYAKPGWSAIMYRQHLPNEATQAFGVGGSKRGVAQRTAGPGYRIGWCGAVWCGDPCACALFSACFEERAPNFPSSTGALVVGYGGHR
jgi:hypothetical protein